MKRHTFIYITGLWIALGAVVACERKIADEYPAEVTTFTTEGGQGLPFFSGKDMRPIWQPGAGDSIRALGEFRLRDQTDREFTSGQLRGKITVVSFFFSHCSGICPITTGNLLKVQNQLRNDDRVMIVSFTVTPDVDTPAKLADFARQRQISPARWRLLTGERKAIYRLARESLGADTLSPKENALKAITENDFLHSEKIYLLDSAGRLRGIYTGRMPAAPAEILRDVEILKQSEAAESAVAHGGEVGHAG